MLRLLLERFWPIFLPIALYLLWLAVMGRRARRNGQPVLTFFEGPWFWPVLATILLAIGCFILLGTENTPQQGPYAPPHMVNGQIVPGKVNP